MEWISKTAKEKCQWLMKLPSNSQMLTINWIKNKKIRKLIKEAKMTELDLQNKRPKAKEKTPSWRTKLLVQVISENNQKKWQIQIWQQQSISPNTSELEGWEVSSSQSTNTWRSTSSWNWSTRRNNGNWNWRARRNWSSWSIRKNNGNSC